VNTDRAGLDRDGVGPGLPSLIGRLDAACNDYEAAWKAGRRPPIESYLEAVPDRERPGLLRELLALELELRREGGERPSPGDYRERFPDQVEVVGQAFRLADRVAAGSAAVPGLDIDTTETGLPGRAAPPCRSPSIPGYQVLAELGRGGMGVVYLAHRVLLNRPCALKMILAGAHAGPEASVRFLAEAETIARLRHEGIVQIYGIGDHDGCPYIELEYLEGGSLAQALDGTPRPGRQAAALVRTMADAVGAAHRQGIVHRDLKPANVLLTADGRPKVADFGLAKTLGADSGLTRTESVLGSPSYMAPEQADGRSRDAGAAADIYALGAILYELLTGRPPFRGATVLQTLEQVKSAEPIPPSRFQPGLARDVETICLKCLQKEAGHRYATAGDLAEDLWRFLDGHAIRARRAGAAERTWRWCRRNPVVAGLLGLLTAFIVTSFVVVLGLWRRSEGLRIESESRRIDAERNALAAAAERRHARAESARLVLERGIQECEHDELGPGLLSMARSLELAEEADPEVGRAARANLAAWGRQAHRLRQVFGHPAALGGLAIRPDGRVLAANGGDGRIRLWDPVSGRPVGRDLVHRPPGDPRRPSSVSPSVRTGRRSPRPGRTARCSSGMPETATRPGWSWTIRLPSSRWPSAPTAGSSPPDARMESSGSGTRRRAGASGRRCVTRRGRSRPWPSAPTASCWPRAGPTERPDSGGWPMAGRPSRRSVTPATSTPWPSTPAGGTWPPAARGA
jgi:hypothetical protein